MLNGLRNPEVIHPDDRPRWPKTGFCTRAKLGGAPPSAPKPPGVARRPRERAARSPSAPKSSATDERLGRTERASKIVYRAHGAGSARVRPLFDRGRCPCGAVRRRPYAQPGGTVGRENARARRAHPATFCSRRGVRWAERSVVADNRHERSTGGSEFRTRPALEGSQLKLRRAIKSQTPLVLPPLCAITKCGDPGD
jgi:hypothetical protein